MAWSSRTAALRRSISSARITCRGTKPLILHRYSLSDLFALWDGSLPLRPHSDGVVYTDDKDRPALPRAILQSLLTRAASTVGIELTEKQRLVPGMRLIGRFYPLQDGGKVAIPEVDARTGDGRRAFRRLEGISVVLPRWDRWSFTVKVEFGANMTYARARRLWDTAGRFGLGDAAPRLGTFTIVSWE